MANSESTEKNIKDGNEITAEQKGGGFWQFILRHKINTLLFLLLIGLFAWSQFKINQLSHKVDQSETYYLKWFNNKLDSLDTDRLQLTAKALSWTLRSELLRDNLEQVDHYFNDFVKHPDVLSLQFLGTADSTIVLSTNKNKQGQKADLQIIRMDQQQTQSDSFSITITTPVMGLNSKLGVLVMEVRKD